MPKVGTFDIRIDGIYYHLNLHFTQKDGFNVRGFPDSVRLLTQDHGALRGHDTIDELKQAIRKRVDAFHEATRVTKKLIAYKLEMPLSEVMNFAGEGTWRGQKEGIPDAMANKLECGSHAKGFVIEWKILSMTANGDTKVYYVVEQGPGGEDIEGSTWHFGYNEKWGFMEWSPQRQAFFESIDKGIDQMVNNIASFFSLASDEMIARIDNGRKLLGS